jgi:cytochrome d ubiquinol oxidase subunit II
VCLLHGAVFLALRTEGPVRRRARTAALAASAVAIPVAVVALAGMGSLPALVAMGVLAAAPVLVFLRREGWAFTAMAAAIMLVSVAVFSRLRGAPLPGLTLAEAASGPYTLTMLTWIGLIALPFVLGYQGWTYWVFRKRVQVAVRS